jgi:CRP-like cAMP-binding protein
MFHFGFMLCASNVQTLSSMNSRVPPLDSNISYRTPHAIDFIGAGTFQVSQLDVLQKRSMEVAKTLESNLSARGLHHRNKDFFTKDVRSSSAIISQTLLQGVRDPKINGQTSVYLRNQYFQRALGYERLGQIDRAIEDYTRCLSISSQYSECYFNRGGLYLAQGKLEAANQDFDKAIELSPTCTEYLENRSLLYRRRGMFSEATQDIFNSRLLKQRNETQGLKLNKSVSNGLANEDDPVIVFMKRSYLDREERSAELQHVIDFLKGIKFFSGIVNDQQIMRTLAQKVRLVIYEKDTVIFQEGDRGTNFYVVIDGEISIVKLIKDPLTSVVTAKNVLVKLFRAQTFGETALNSVTGLRTAGAEAQQKSHLLALEIEDYKYILHSYRSALRLEIKEALTTSALFSTWESVLIDKLCEHAIVKTYTAGTVVLASGEVVNDLYIVRRGIVKLVKSIIQPPLTNIKIDEFATPDSVNGMENPGLWVLKKNWKDVLVDDTIDGGGDTAVAASANTSSKLMGGNADGRMEFTVGVLGSGQMFGELSVLSPGATSPTTAVSYTNLEIYVFDAQILIGLGAKFNGTTMNFLNESLNLYNPPAEKIGHYYR